MRSHEPAGRRVRMAGASSHANDAIAVPPALVGCPVVNEPTLVLVTGLPGTDKSAVAAASTFSHPRGSDPAARDRTLLRPGPGARRGHGDGPHRLRRQRCAPVAHRGTPAEHPQLVRVDWEHVCRSRSSWDRPARADVVLDASDALEVNVARLRQVLATTTAPRSGKPPGPWTDLPTDVRPTCKPGSQATARALERRSRSRRPLPLRS